jgi:intraflagellar transport protein 122
LEFRTHGDIFISLHSLLDIGRRLTPGDKKSLQLIATHLRRLKALPLAAEIYRKMGDETEVIQLHVEAHDWAEAFRLAERTPQALPEIHLQHARWLAESDQFIAAQEAYMKAGKPKEATKLLKDLADCAIVEERYSDAGYYIWLRAKQVLNFMQKSEEEKADLVDEEQPQKPADSLREFRTLMKLASVYYAYSTIHSYLREPFTSSPPLTLFNTSRYVANQIEGNSGAGLPKGVSLFAIFYTLSKQAKVLGANKLHLQINNKLQSLKPPPSIQDQVDVRSLKKTLVHKDSILKVDLLF